MADATSGKVPVFDCVKAAYQFLVGNWQRFLPSALIVALVSQAAPLVFALSDSGAAEQQTVLQQGLSQIVVSLPALLAGVFFSAAVLRKAVRDEFVGRTGLTFGADEARLLGVLGSMLLLFVPLIALVTGVLGIVVLPRLAAAAGGDLEALLADPDAMSAALTAALGPEGEAALSLFIFLCMGIGLWLLTKLYMVNAATIGEKRVVMFQTWSWSRGNVLRMIGAIILTGLPAMVVNTFVENVAVSVLQSLPAGSLWIAFMIGVVVSLVAAMASIPVAALAAAFYKGLRPADFVAK